MFERCFELRIHFQKTIIRNYNKYDTHLQKLISVKWPFSAALQKSIPSLKYRKKNNLMVSNHMI